MKCEYTDDDSFIIKQCHLPDIESCEGNWLSNFTIFGSSHLPENIDKIADENGQQYCCHYNKDGGDIEENKVCNWKNKDIFNDGDFNVDDKGKGSFDNEGTTGFLCKWLGNYENQISDTNIPWKNYTIDVSYNEFRSGLVSLEGLLDPDTNLPWYDTGRQWPKQSECSYGSAMDQMTMTYISFTGYLR